MSDLWFVLAFDLGFLGLFSSRASRPMRLNLPRIGIIILVLDSQLLTLD